MTDGPKRDLLKIIFQNFIKSLWPKQFRGNYMGEDYFGNKYYEIPANPARGKERMSRWFVPPNKEDFDQELTAEWEAWLRGRRDTPPTKEELLRNLQLIELKKKNATIINEKYANDENNLHVESKIETIGSFPKYKDYTTKIKNDSSEN